MTNTRLMVTVDGGEPISWAAFAAANAEALGADGLAAVLRDLRACGEHVGGGGAGAEYTVHAIDGAAHDLAVLREYAALRRQPSNLARFAREFSARDRANADRVEAAIEAAMVVRGGGR